MSLFKNEVGRPSNETLRKRKTVIAILAVLVVALVGVGIYFGVSFFNKKDANSTGMNIDPDATRSEHPQVNIIALNLSTNAPITSAKNRDLLLSGWRNYPVRFKITASSKNSKIKSIVVKWNNSGITSTSNSKYKTLTGSKTVNGYETTSDYKAQGARYGTVTVTDKKNRKTTVKIGANIDLTPPKISWNLKTEHKKGIYKNIATCVDTGGSKLKTFAVDDQLRKTGEVNLPKTYDKHLNLGDLSINEADMKFEFEVRGKTKMISYCYDNAGNKTTSTSQQIKIK